MPNKTISRAGLPCFVSPYNIEHYSLCAMIQRLGEKGRQDDARTEACATLSDVACALGALSTSDCDKEAMSAALGLLAGVTALAADVLNKAEDFDSREGGGGEYV